MKQKAGLEYASAFFSKDNSENYDHLVHYATFGMDSRWKKKILEKVESDSIVLELACGTGILSAILSQAGNTVLGLDYTFSYLKVLKQKGIKIPVVNSTAELIPFRSTMFDYIITSYLPKYTTLDILINECFRLLKSGGMIILHDFTFPKYRLYKVAWEGYFKIISLLWRKDKRWKYVFDELDVLIRSSQWDLNVFEELEKLKFSQIHKRYLTFQTSAIITAIKP
ncbi:MAG TPA: class I SAM-dependent methyltransferase [Candidatus Nitrosocosmicus sp.]|nr:class I SAM-dependent methyltransferase [Candidatus Nitrosocosmicus sp.]